MVITWKYFFIKLRKSENSKRQEFARLLAVCFSLEISAGIIRRGYYGTRHGHGTPRLLLYTTNAICVHDD